MISSDNYISIKIKSSADTAGFDTANKKIGDLTKSAHEFVETIKLGVGIDLGGKLVNSVAAIPNILQAAIRRGVEFNATLTGAEQGIANVIAKFQKLDAVAARNEAAKAMAKIAEIEPQSAAGLGDLVQGFMATFAASQSAGVSIEQNIELVGAFANALANANIPAEQLSQELRSIFTGNITADSALAKTLQISNQDVARAKEAGNLYQFLKEQIGTLGEAGDTFQVRWSTLQSAIDKTLATISRPVFDEIFRSLQSLNAEIQKPEVANGLKAIGHDVAALVHNGAALTEWAIRHADTLTAAARAVGMFGLAWAGLKLGNLIVGLGAMAVQWVRNAAAIEVETIAVVANTRAKQANAIAGAQAATAGAVGSVGKGSALGGLLRNNFTPMALAGVAGYEAGSWIDRQTGFSDKTSDAMSGVKWGTQNDDLRQQMASVEQQIKLADTVEKKLEAEAALRKLIVDFQERARAASGGERENLEANLRYLQNMSDQRVALEGSAVRTVAAQKQAADDTARQADELAAVSARAELDYQIAQAKTEANEALVRQLEAQKQLEGDIATLRKNYGDAGMTPETARAIAKEFQAARQAAEDLKRAEETGQMRHALSEAGLDDEPKRAQQLQNLYEDYYRQTRLNRAELPMDDADQMFDVAQAAQSKEGMETAIKIKELKKEIADSEKRAAENETKRAEDEQKKAFEEQKRRDLALDALAESVEINRAKIAGDDELVKKLERQRDIRAEINRLLELGVEKTEAEARATESVNARYGALTAEEKRRESQQALQKTGRARSGESQSFYAGPSHSWSAGGAESYNPALTGELSATSPSMLEHFRSTGSTGTYQGTDFKTALRQRMNHSFSKGIAGALPAGVSPATAHDDLKGGTDKTAGQVTATGRGVTAAIDQLGQTMVDALQDAITAAKGAQAKAEAAMKLAQNALLDQGQAT